MRPRLAAPAAVVGCSFGGRIAIELVAARPDLVDRLVLIGAGLGSWSWSESAQAGFAEEEEAIERGELAAAAAQQARMWLAADAEPEVRERRRR
jgi:pimeloyl-ACP methyl ester carboxylesterase